jgi:hypothetical protein
LAGIRKLVQFWTLIAASLIAVTGFTWQVAQPQTVLQVDPQELRINVGEEATVDLAIQQVSELYGIEVHLTFDPNVLQIVDADAGQEGVQIEPGTLPVPDFVVQNIADNQQGTIDYASTQLPPNEPGEGDGVIARIRIKAARPGTSQLQLDRFLLADTGGDSIAATSRHGQVTVVANRTWIWIAIAGLVLLVIVVGVGLAFTRRK